MATMKKKQQKCPPAPAKEVWHDWHKNKSLRNVYLAAAASLATTLTFYFLYNRPRINRYREFYENYDADAAFRRMHRAGIFSSIAADEDIEDDDNDDQQQNQAKKK